MVPDSRRAFESVGPVSLLRIAFSLASPGGARAKLSILIFHRVLERPDPLFPSEVDREQFARICGWLREWCNVMPLDEAMRLLRSGELPRRAAAITFDDGYRDNHDIALPILRAHGLAATFFVATGYLEDGCMWNDVIIEAIRRTGVEHIDIDDSRFGWTGRLPLISVEQRRAALSFVIPRAKYLPPDERSRFSESVARLLGAPPPSDLMLTRHQVRLLADAGMHIGAHTVTHPILAKCGEDEVVRELTCSREVLQDIVQRPVSGFAYPNGVPGDDVGAREARLARESGYDYAVTTQWGHATRRSDPFMLPRFSPWDRSRSRFGARLLSNLLTPTSRYA